VWTWLSLVITTSCLGIGLISLVRVLPRSPAKFRREVSVALTSAMVYLLMSLPFFIPSVWAVLTPRLQANYIWLPFWYAFVLTKMLGSFFQVATYSILGTLVAVFAMVFLNYLLPGGAGLYSETKQAEQFSWTSWLGHGYKPWVAWLFCACFVYGTFLSRWNVCMKQYALGFFATTIVDFMNPKTDSTAFVAVLWNYNFSFNVNGPVLTSVYVTLLAVPLAALSLPVIPCWRRWRRFFSCRAIASRGLSRISADTCGSLDRLITYFREDSTNYNVESSFLYIRQLGARRRDIEDYLVQAKWECWNSETKARLRGLFRVAGMLHDLRQALRVQLELVRGTRENPAQVFCEELGPHLHRFLEATSDAMIHVASYPVLQRGLTREQFEEIINSASVADAALLEALQVVPRGNRRERIFIDCLRTFPAVLTRFAKEAVGELEDSGKSRGWQRGKLWEWLPCRTCLVREQHIHAIRNTVSWLLALFWSVMVQRATCVTTVSFIFSPSLGSLFDRNVNRILGVGMGLALGNLPAAMLLKPECYESHCFAHYPTGPIVYLQLMFIQWAVAVYGYLATGSRFSYACLLWAGFSGVQMLQSMHTPYGRHHHSTDSSLFLSTMDNMLGCFIVFGVDIIASHLLVSRTVEQVATHVTQSLQAVANMIGRLRDDDWCCEDMKCIKSDLFAIKQSIKRSRHWDDEARKEDHVWTTARLLPYKADLVQALLQHLDDTYVAFWGLLAAAERCDRQCCVKSLVQDSLPGGLESRCRLYAKVAGVALIEKKGREEKVQGVSPDPHIDQALRIADAISLAEEPAERDGEASAGGAPRDSPRGPRPVPTSGLTSALTRYAFSDAAGGAAALSVHADCCASRQSMQRIQALLHEHTFWEARDWRAPASEEEFEDEPPIRLSGTQREEVRQSSSAEEEEDEEDSTSEASIAPRIDQSPCATPLNRV